MRPAPLLLVAALALPGIAQAQKGGGPAVAPPAPPAALPAAPAGRSSDAVAIAALPPQIANLQRQEGITDYEARPNGRGLGASINYEVSSGSPYATVYLYNRNRSDLTGSAVGPAVDQELGVTRREIEGASERRGYRIGSVRRLPDIPGADGQPAFRCDAFTFEYTEEQTVADSFACVGIARNRFVKLRVSYRPRATTVPARELPMDFMRGVADATGFGQGGGGRPATGGKG